MMQAYSATCSQPEGASNTNPNSAVTTSLNNFVLGRMRNSALQKWQPKPHATAPSSPNDSKGQDEPKSAQEVPSYLSCPLCFEEKSKPEVHALSQCSHEFCRDCLARWTNKASEGCFPSCPLCRGPITTEDMNAILDPSTHFLLQDEEMGYGDDDDHAPLTISPRLGPILYAEDLLDLPSISLESRFSFMGWV